MDVTPWVDRLADLLKEAGSIRSPEVEAAFRTVRRHELLETFYVKEGDDLKAIHHQPAHPARDHLDVIYSHQVLLTRLADNLPTSSTSMPGLVAEMQELLALRPGMRVLEIGLGTGYNAALMAELVGDQTSVVSLDIQEDVVSQTRRLMARAGYGNVRLLARDGFEGVPQERPFDRIVATVGCPDISPPLG